MHLAAIPPKLWTIVLTLIASFAISGCASTSADLLEKDDGSMTVKDSYIWKTTAYSAAAGAAVGAIGGQLIFKNTAGTVGGAAIGAAIGGLIGNAYASDVKSKVEAAGNRRQAILNETATLREDTQKVAALNQQLASDIQDLKRERDSLATSGLTDPSAKERKLAFERRVADKQKQYQTEYAAQRKALDHELGVAGGLGAAGETQLTDDGDKKLGAQASTQELQALDAQMRDLRAEWKRLRAQRDELASLK